MLVSCLCTGHIVQRCQRPLCAVTLQWNVVCLLYAVGFAVITAYLGRLALKLGFIPQFAGVFSCARMQQGSGPV